MNSDGLIEEIKSRVDIVEFISDYVPLKKSGQNFKGLCPFHSEKTPSFMVSQPKQIFHCFGCGAGGDVVTFLMKHDNLSFGEALRYMAKKAGIKADFGSGKNAYALRENMLRVNDKALEFFVKNLGASKPAMDYLQKRGISEESLKVFSVGYAPDQWDALLNHLKKSGFEASLMQKAGLIVSDGRGSRDSFRRRIIFPILNMRDDVIAFGGRVMDNSLPKYINSPETEVFKKGETLFAINLSKEEIRKKGYAVIVEGYLDAIVCHQYGFKNTVAPLGTALTSRHLHKLRSLTNKVVLVFDGDPAGVSAAARSLSILCDSDFKAKVLLLPEGEDPDSYLRRNGAQSFHKLIAGALSMVDFLMVASKGEKTDRVREALGMIAKVKDILLAEEMLAELADRSRMNESALRSELERVKKKPGSQALTGAKPVAVESRREEVLLLSALISSPERAEAALRGLDIEALRDETVKSLFRKMKTLGDKVSLTSLLDDTSETERTLVTRLSVDPGFDPELVSQNIEDCLQKIAYKSFEDRKRAAEAKKPDDASLHDSLLKEKRRFIKGANP